MASKYNDPSAYSVAGTDRTIQAKVGCDFVATGSGSYFSRSCHNAAAWVEGWTGSDGVFIGDKVQHRNLRCNRHRAIDERTAANRGWGGREYKAFDAVAEAAVLRAESADRAKHAKMLADHAALLVDLKNALSRKALSEVDTKVVERMLAAYSA